MINNYYKRNISFAEVQETLNIGDTITLSIEDNFDFSMPNDQSLGSVTFVPQEVEFYCTNILFIKL